MFPYNPCMVVGDDIWVAGQIGIDGGDSMAEQAASALSKIDALLGKPEQTKQIWLWSWCCLEDMAEFGEFNEVYALGWKVLFFLLVPLMELGITCGAKVEVVAGCTGFRVELSLKIRLFTCHSHDGMMKEKCSV